MVSVALLSSPALHRELGVTTGIRLEVNVSSNQVPSLELRQDGPVSAPADGVTGPDGCELTPQAQTLRVSAHSLSLDGLHHLCFCGMVCFHPKVRLRRAGEQSQDVLLKG